MSYSVTLADLIDEFELTQLNKEVDITDITIRHPEINRPALQLSGFFDHFDSDRLQIIGKVECAYIDSMSDEQKASILTRLFGYKIPCIVICRGMTPIEEMLAAATLAGIPLLQTSDLTTDFMGEVIRWLKVKLAPRVTLHGVLVDVYGEGVLIMGESGIGKSETALELIKRGHRLVADDAVEIKKVSNQTLIGSSPELIRHFIELRGIGIINVKQMFGVESIKITQTIDIIIKLELWDKDKEYDRFGLGSEYMEILGNKVVCNSIPIRPGRNISVICESAAINHRQKKMGYDAARAFSDRVNANIEAQQR